MKRVTLVLVMLCVSIGWVSAQSGTTQNLKAVVANGCNNPCNCREYLIRCCYNGVCRTCSRTWCDCCDTMPTSKTASDKTAFKVSKVGAKKCGESAVPNSTELYGMYIPSAAEVLALLVN